MIGHNPGLEDLTVALAGDADEAALDQIGRKFPTGARGARGLDRVATLGPGAARLTRLDVPRR